MRKIVFAGLFLRAVLCTAFASDEPQVGESYFQADIGQRARFIAGVVSAREAAVVDRNAKIVDLNARFALATNHAASCLTYDELPVNATITTAGQQWEAQTPRILAGPDGSFRFSAKAGDRASFDPPRKLRTELIGLKRFATGEPIRLKGTFFFESALLVDSEWNSFIQIHQADTLRADGTPVLASPLFAAELLRDVKGGYMVQIRGETGKGLQPTFSPMRVLGKLRGVTLGPHTFDLMVTDGHGGDGQITFVLDGKKIVDFRGRTGYEYVDLLSNAWPIRGKPQETGSYLKLGIYAGKASGNAPPAAFIDLTLKDLAVP